MAEILVIAYVLSIQNPRERLLEVCEETAKTHECFTDERSDFLAYLNIWDSFQRECDKDLSDEQLMQRCRQCFLSHLRMRKSHTIEMGLTTKEAAFRRPLGVRQLLL